MYNEFVKPIVIHQSAVEYLPPKLIEAKEDSITSAITAAFGRTWDGIVKTFSSYKKLFMFEVSMKNIGGPFAMAFMIFC